ncbi:UNVERIFIED_CONTAM: hypothetical protein FKN15_064813 [Acipenser sinensis]
MPAAWRTLESTSHQFCSSAVSIYDTLSRGTLADSETIPPSPSLSAVLMKRQRGAASVFIRHLGQQM